VEKAVREQWPGGERASWCNELLLTRPQLSASRTWANGRTTRHEASGMAVDGALLSAEDMQLDCGSLPVPRDTQHRNVRVPAAVGGPTPCWTRGRASSLATSD
jgi:hypothetical protein